MTEVGAVPVLGKPIIGTVGCTKVDEDEGTVGWTVSDGRDPVPVLLAV